MKYKDLTAENISSLGREELEKMVLLGKENSDKRYFASQESLSDAVDKINRIGHLNTVLEAEKKQWIDQKIMQEQIVQHQIGNSDTVVNQLQDEIRSVKRQLCSDCLKKVI